MDGIHRQSQPSPARVAKAPLHHAALTDGVAEHRMERLHNKTGLLSPLVGQEVLQFEAPHPTSVLSGSGKWQLKKESPPSPNKLEAGNKCDMPTLSGSYIGMSVISGGGV